MGLGLFVENLLLLSKDVIPIDGFVKGGGRMGLTAKESGMN